MKKFILVFLILTGLAGLTGCEDIINVRGVAYTFEAYQPIPGALVYVVEEPEIRTTTGSDGAFILSIPVSIEIPEITLAIKPDDRVETQSATFSFTDITALETKTFHFQVPSMETYYTFLAMLGINPDPAKGHIVSTVSKKVNTDPYPIMDPGMGYAGVTVNISPDSGYEVFSYFDRIASIPIPFPNLTLTQTMDDGGVVWGNINPGTYHISAHKTGVYFKSLKVKVRPGVLTNAAPPFSLMEIVTCN